MASSEVNDHILVGGRRWLPALLSVAALALAALGQRRLSLEPPALREGMLLFILAALFLLAARLSPRRLAPAREELPSSTTENELADAPVEVWRWAMTIAGLGIIIVVLRGLDRIPR